MNRNRGRKNKKKVLQDNKRCSRILFLLCEVKFKVKVKKVKLSLCLNKHHAMETYGGVKVSSTHSLTSALDGGEWSALRPGRFTPRKRDPRSPLYKRVGGGPRALLDTVVKRKIPSSRWESNPRIPFVQPVAYSLYRLSYHGSS
jgi:hypothetical protein